VMKNESAEKADDKVWSEAENASSAEGEGL